MAEITQEPQAGKAEERVYYPPEAHDGYPEDRVEQAFVNIGAEIEETYGDFEVVNSDVEEVSRGTVHVEVLFK